MNPEMGSFTSMDTWQGDLYEPVTLHKYLYANANPVKYKDPSGMFSLPECNIASAIGAELYQNQNVILGMSLLNGIGKSVMTGLCGGDAGDMTEAFLEGMIEGAAMGMLFCAAAAVLATSMLTVMMAHTTASSVVSIVLAIYSVSEGDYLNALVYGAVAVAGIIGVCRWWKVSHRVEITGDKGTIALRARQETSNFIETPYGKAFQNTTGEAIKVKVYVQSGGDLYRGGKLGHSNTTNAQFWATDNPLTPGYADKYGVDFSKLDYIIKGKLKSGEQFITRPAPGLGSNKGGGIEVVTPPNSVDFDYFIMIEGK